MEYQAKGTIKTILQVQTGTAKSGDEWKKIEFVVSNNSGYEGREQLYCFQIFGGEKVDNFLKYNKQGAEVLVKFSIQTNEYQGRYFTSLSAYRVESGERVEQSAQSNQPQHVEDEGQDEVPF